MKKIGIITWYGSKNYGTCLQSYALFNKLKKLGYECRIITPFKYIPYLSIDIINILRFFKNLIKKCDFYTSSAIEKKIDIQQERINKFSQSNLSIEIIKTEHDYKKLIRNYDIFITGSDQIWNPYHFNLFNLLNFAPKKKKVAYATSIGVTEIPQNKVKIYKKYLSRFSHFGMREQAAVDIIHQLLPNKDVCKVLDPTFLLSSKEWKQFGNGGKCEFKLPENYMLCYLLGKNENYKFQVLDIFKKSKIENIVIIKSVENSDFKIEGAIQYSNGGPKEFIQLINNSKLVVTDSFHASSICINTSKPFIEFLRFSNTDKKSQNSRIYELLEHYHLRDRFYHKEMDVNLKIDYNSIQPILDKDRKESLSYLIDAIEN